MILLKTHTFYFSLFQQITKYNHFQFFKLESIMDRYKNYAKIKAFTTNSNQIKILF